MPLKLFITQESFCLVPFTNRRLVPVTKSKITTILPKIQRCPQAPRHDENRQGKGCIILAFRDNTVDQRPTHTHANTHTTQSLPTHVLSYFIWERLFCFCFLFLTQSIDYIFRRLDRLEEDTLDLRWRISPHAVARGWPPNLAAIQLRPIAGILSHSDDILSVSPRVACSS